MAWTNADLLALKDEITNDPNGLGLVAPPEIDDVGNADKLNEVLEAQQIDRETISTNEIFLHIDRDEYVALPAADRDYLNAATQGGTVNPQTGSEFREAILQMFGPQSETRTNLVAMLTEAASRINQMHAQGLLSQGGSVTPSDIANARNAT